MNLVFVLWSHKLSYRQHGSSSEPFPQPGPANFSAEGLQLLRCDRD